MLNISLVYTYVYLACMVHEKIKYIFLIKKANVTIPCELNNKYNLNSVVTIFDLPTIFVSDSNRLEKI